jgi:hypothetical protein
LLISATVWAPVTKLKTVIKIETLDFDIENKNIYDSRKI